TRADGGCHALADHQLHPRGPAAQLRLESRVPGHLGQALRDDRAHLAERVACAAQQQDAGGGAVCRGSALAEDLLGQSARLAAQGGVAGVLGGGQQPLGAQRALVGRGALGGERGQLGGGRGGAAAARGGGG